MRGPGGVRWVGQENHLEGGTLPYPYLSLFGGQFFPPLVTSVSSLEIMTDNQHPQAISLLIWPHQESQSSRIKLWCGPGPVCVSHGAWRGFEVEAFELHHEWVSRVQTIKLCLESCNLQSRVLLHSGRSTLTWAVPLSTSYW